MNIKLRSIKRHLFYLGYPKKRTIQIVNLLIRKCNIEIKNSHKQILKLEKELNYLNK